MGFTLESDLIVVLLFSNDGILVRPASALKRDAVVYVIVCICHTSSMCGKLGAWAHW